MTRSSVLGLQRRAVRAFSGRTLCVMGDSQMRNVFNSIVHLVGAISGDERPCDAEAMHLGTASTSPHKVRRP
eukprot:2290966-Prymnesium_polylepis.1